MKDLAHVMTEITQLTSNIETNFPELYKFLDETPLTINNKAGKEISKVDLANYLEELKQMLKHYMEEHKKEKA